MFKVTLHPTVPSSSAVQPSLGQLLPREHSEDLVFPQRSLQWRDKEGDRHLPLQGTLAPAQFANIK